MFTPSWCSQNLSLLSETNAYSKCKSWTPPESSQIRTAESGSDAHPSNKHFLWFLRTSEFEHHYCGAWDEATGPLAMIVTSSIDLGKNLMTSRKDAKDKRESELELAQSEPLFSLGDLWTPKR